MAEEDTAWPDDAKQDDLMQLYATSPDSFRDVIMSIMQANPDKFNVLQLNQDSDDNHTSLTKEAFGNTFRETFKPALLNLVFDLIDVGSTGSINQAALIAFVNGRAPRNRVTPDIDSRWLLNTIKGMNFGKMDADSNGKIDFEEMKQFFSDKGVAEDVVRLVFDEIVQEQSDKTSITYKTFFQWRDKFTAKKLRTWSHVLSSTMILTNLPSLDEDSDGKDEAYEMVDTQQQAPPPPQHGKDEEYDMVPQQQETYDTATHQADLLRDICKVLDLPDDDSHVEQLTAVVKQRVEELNYQLAEARMDTREQERQTQAKDEDAKLMKTEVYKHKAATKQLARHFTDLLGESVDTDDPKALLGVIERLQSKMADEALATKQTTAELQFENAKLTNNLGDARFALQKLKKELSETLGEHNENDDPMAVNDLFARLQFQIADIKYENRHQRRASIALQQEKDKINDELAGERVQFQQLQLSVQPLLDLDLSSAASDDLQSVRQLIETLQSTSSGGPAVQTPAASSTAHGSDELAAAQKEITSLQYENSKLAHDFGAAQFALQKLKKELGDTLGEHNLNDDPMVVSDLFKRLQDQVRDYIVDIKSENEHVRRASVALQQEKDQIGYALADERMQLKELTELLQDIIEIDVANLDMEDVKQIIENVQDTANSGPANNNDDSGDNTTSAAAADKQELERVQFENAKLNKDLGAARFALQKLKKELGDTLGEHNLNDDPMVVSDLFKRLQDQVRDYIVDIKSEKEHVRRASMALQQEKDQIGYALADERMQLKELKELLQEIIEMDLANADVNEMKEIMQNVQEIANEETASDNNTQKEPNDDAAQQELTRLQFENAKLNNDLGTARFALEKLKRDLTETLGERNQSDDPMVVNELFKRLQDQVKEYIVDMKSEKEHVRRASMVLQEEKDKITHDLADERLQYLSLKQSVQDVLDVDVSSVELGELRQLIVEVQQLVNDETDRSMTRSQRDAQDEIQKADTAIGKVDMDREIGRIEEDDEDRAYENISDAKRLQGIIKTLKAELRDSRTNHVVVSETKTNLEVQTFDLQSKLTNEKKKYVKLLRASQQIGFDPADLGITQAEQQNGANGHHDDDDEDGDGGMNGNAGGANGNGHAMQVSEQWAGSGQELQDEIQRLKEELSRQTQDNLTISQKLEEEQQLSSRLRLTNRKHKRRESEVLDHIGANAHDVVVQLEELETKRREVADKELKLNFLMAEQKRLEIAYEHAQGNARQYREQVKLLKGTITKLEAKGTKGAEDAEVLTTKVNELEEKAKLAENLELDLAYFRAQSQRMAVDMGTKDTMYKEQKTKAKTLQQEVTHEKEKVRRLSQQIHPSEVQQIGEVESLKSELADEQSAKQQLQQEVHVLQRKLSNQETTQATRDNGDDDEDDDPARDGDDEESNASELSGDGDGADLKEEVNELKFKLSHYKVQNAELKRRVSVAGIEKEQRSQLWEQPRVTIQMVSEFIERLPLKHKEKIWLRHSTGHYIARNKIVHTLHSFVALCIKIKDRTAMAPSRTEIEAKLQPFADVINYHVDNANGLSLAEFNTDLHMWILEPVSGLVLTNDEQLQMQQELETVRDELHKTQREKAHIQRKSQMDLTSLLEKMKGFEASEPLERADELEGEVEDLQQIVDGLQEQIGEKDTALQQKDALIEQLNQEMSAIKPGGVRESEDEEERPEDQEQQVPQLIEETDADREFSEERLEFYQNDTNIVKSQAYIGWKRKAQDAKREIETLERARKQSVEQVSELQDQVQQLSTQKEQVQAQSTQKEQHIEEFKEEISKFKERHEQDDKIRRNSVVALHNNLFSKLLDAEAEHEEMVASYKQKIGKLQKDNESFEDLKRDFEAGKETKFSTIKMLSATMEELRVSVSALSKQNTYFKRRIDVLENRGLISALSGFMG